ncbi:MAG: hypothetical protein ACRDKZ_12290 [Actinomycetota bacterium]
MGAASKRRVCGGCGAELPVGSTACPLCGTDAAAKVEWGSSPKVEKNEVTGYHSDLCKLRDELKKLREDDAEAV